MRLIRARSAGNADENGSDTTLGQAERCALESGLVRVMETRAHHGFDLGFANRIATRPARRSDA